VIVSLLIFGAGNDQALHKVTLGKEQDQHWDEQHDKRTGFDYIINAYQRLIILNGKGNRHPSGGGTEIQRSEAGFIPCVEEV
jgi:hypothetical protein